MPPISTCQRPSPYMIQLLPTSSFHILSHPPTHILSHSPVQTMLIRDFPHSYSNQNLLRRQQICETFLTILPVYLSDLFHTSICACITVDRICLHSTLFHEDGNHLFILVSLEPNTGAQLICVELEWGGRWWIPMEGFREAVMPESLLRCHPPPAGLQTCFWKCPEAIPIMYDVIKEVAWKLKRLTCPEKAFSLQLTKETTKDLRVSHNSFHVKGKQCPLELTQHTLLKWALEPSLWVQLWSTASTHCTLHHVRRCAMHITYICHLILSAILGQILWWSSSYR